MLGVGLLFAAGPCWGAGEFVKNHPVGACHIVRRLKASWVTTVFKIIGYFGTVTLPALKLLEQLFSFSLAREATARIE